MYESIKLERFRGFQNFEIKGLSKVNLFTGSNGAGKSSVLEAVFLLSGGANAALAATIAGVRGMENLSPGNETLFKSLFSNLDFSVNCKVSGVYKNLSKSSDRSLTISPILGALPSIPSTKVDSLLGVSFEFKGPRGIGKSEFAWSEAKSGADPNKRSLQLGGQTAVNADLINAVYMSPSSRQQTAMLADLLGELVKKKRTRDLIAALQMVDKRVVDVLPLSTGGEPEIVADIGAETLFPLPLLGEGLRRIFEMGLYSLGSSFPVVLIDEIENGMHYSVFEDLAKFILQTSIQTGHQFFISTHSREFLEAFSAVSEESKFTDMALFRVSASSKTRTLTRFDSSQVQDLAEMHADLR